MIKIIILTIILTSYGVLLQGGLPVLNVTLQEIETGHLTKDQRQYFFYQVDHAKLANSILSFRIKGGDMFTDPDVYLSLAQKEDFDPNHAEYKCFSWGEDVCSVNDKSVAGISRLYGVIMCQFDCDYELSLAITRMVQCENQSESSSNPDDLSTQCMLYFMSGNIGRDQAFLRFHVPDNPNIQRVTFLAQNDIYSDGAMPKIDMWVQEGNDTPETNCACHRGYSLFQRAIGFTLTKDKLKLGSNYTMLLEQYQQQDQSFSTRTKIQMIVEMKNQVPELQLIGKGVDMTVLKRGIVPYQSTNCYKYNVKMADSHLNIRLETHTGVTRLFIGKGEPVLQNNQYQSNAYYQNQAQFYSFVDIPPDERIDAQTGYSYLCVQGLTWASYTLLVREYPGNQTIWLIGPSKAYQFQVTNEFNMLYITEASDMQHEVEFKMTPPSPGKLKMYVRPCKLNDPAFSLRQVQGRYFQDLSEYEPVCVPSKRDKNQMRNVQVAQNTDLRGVQSLQILQECANEAVNPQNIYIQLNPCAFLVQIENIEKKEALKFQLQTPEVHFNDTQFLQEHVPETFSVQNRGEVIFYFSVLDEEASQIQIEIDAIHGAVSLFASKWETPNITTHDFSSTRCGRVPDVITINSTKLLAVRPQESQNKRNVLIGDYYVLVKAYADSAFNIVYTLKRGDNQSAAPIYLSLDQPYTGVLKQPGDYALFKFTGGMFRFGGEDVRVSAINLSTSQALKIYVQPYNDTGMPPSNPKDYMFHNTIQNYVLLSHTDPQLDLYGAFFVRVEYPQYSEGSAIRFRINVMSGLNQYFLRSGEAHQAYLEPNYAEQGVFFQFYPLHYQDQMTVTLTDFSGIPLQMFIGIGNGFPSQGNANYGKFNSSAVITKERLKETSQNCSNALDAQDNSGDYLYVDECSIHIGVFLKRAQSSIKSAVHFSIKITEKYNETLQLLVDGRTEYGILFQSVEGLQTSNYYYRLPAMPQDAVFITLTQYFNQTALKVLANVVPLDGGLRMDELRQHLPLISKNEPEYHSSDYLNNEHIRISENDLDKHHCSTKVCYIVMSVVFADPLNNGTAGYDIVISSQTSILLDEEMIYGNVKQGSYMYYEYHNLCEDCSVSFFLNMLSPSTADVDLFVNFSEEQVDLSIPKVDETQFYSNSIKSDVLVITPEKKKEILPELSQTMQGYYLVAVYGSYGDNIHYSLRVSTMTQEVKIVTEGIAESLSEVPAESTNYFIWKNWGSAHINVYVNTAVGDAEIWMNSFQTDIIGEAYNHLPEDGLQAHWSSFKEKTRNKLEINLYDHNEDGHFCSTCYYLIAVKNERMTSYDVMVTTVSRNNTEEGSIEMYLPFSKVTQGHCSPSLVQIWMVTLDANHPDDLEMRIQQSVGHNLLYVDIGFTPLGNDIYNDYVSSYLHLQGQNLLKSQHGLKNLYFSVFCTKPVAYTIEVRSIDPDDAKVVPTQLQKNTPISGSFSRRTMKLFYSLTYNSEAVFVNLSKSPKCDVSIYADFQTPQNRPLIPNQGSSYKHEEMKNGNFLTIIIPKNEDAPFGSKLIFGVYLSEQSIPIDFKENESTCDFTVSTDSLEVQTIQEDVFYLGRMAPLNNIQNANLRNYMNIFEIKNPREGKQLMRVELKPCSNTFIEFCVASQYSTKQLNIESCVGKSEALSGGKKQAEFEVTEPLYYIYVYKEKVVEETETTFFIRAFFEYSYQHIFSVAENDGQLTLTGNLNELETQNSLELKWGTLNQDKGPGQIEGMKNVNYTVFRAPFDNNLRTECDLEREGVEVMATLTDEYKLSFNSLGDASNGVTLNVYAEPLEQYSQGVLYEPIKFGGQRKRSSFFWIFLCLVLAFFTFLGIILACVFRKKLKKKEKELEFEMTDVRNVARINKPAAPYYEVYEEGESSQQTFSGDFEKHQK